MYDSVYHTHKKTVDLEGVHVSDSVSAVWPKCLLHPLKDCGCVGCYADSVGVVKYDRVDHTH